MIEAMTKYINTRQEQLEVDRETRARPSLRIHTAQLVVAFGKLLRKHAEQYARDVNGVSDPYATDHYAELLLWRFVEYAAGFQVCREDIDYIENIPAHYQYTKQHAYNFFKIDAVRGVPVARELDEEA